MLPHLAAEHHASARDSDDQRNPLRHWSAWLVSMTLHTILLVLACLLVAEEPNVAELPDSTPEDRTVAIRLTTTSPDEFLDSSIPQPATGQQPQPSSQMDAKSTSQVPAATSSASDSSHDGEGILEVLPQADEQPNLPPSRTVAESLNVAEAVGVEFDSREFSQSMGKLKAGFGIDEEAVAKLMAAERAELASRENRPIGEPTEISLFGSPTAKGHRFVFVVDRSKSMGGTGLGALQAARTQLLRQLDRLESNHEFQIIAYHNSTVMFGQRKLRPATPQNLKLVPQFFDNLVAYGGTDHEAALHAALNLQPEFIFLLTDGDDPTIGLERLREISLRAGSRTVIHCIQFGTESTSPKETFMKSLAAICGGEYRYINMNSASASHR